MIKSKSPLLLKSGAASEGARELADRISAALAGDYPARPNSLGNVSGLGKP